MNIVKEIKQNKLLHFVLIGGIMYVSWLFLYYLFITKSTNWDYLLNTNLGYLTIEFFSWFSIEVILEEYETVLYFPNNYYAGIRIGDNCNGFKLFSIFSIFIIAYPASWKSKLWFVPLGMFIVHLANVIRIMALMLINDYNPAYLDFNHDYTFTVFVYSIIFGLWYWWLKKYSQTDEKK